MKYFLSLFSISVFVLFFACDEPPVPKPRGYFRIDLPEKDYQTFSSEYCPFTFDYPVYANIERDSLFFNEPAENPCWMNIIFTELNGSIHLSYKKINDDNSIEKLVQDAHKLTFKHTTKAQYIDENMLRNRYGVSGIMYEIGGNAASNAQFFLTDSVEHFIRGALYFRASPNEDSLAPVIQFVKKDMLKLIETLQWKEISVD